VPVDDSSSNRVRALAKCPIALGGHDLAKLAKLADVTGLDTGVKWGSRSWCPGLRRAHSFSSAIPPQWARRTKSLDALLPALYLPRDFGWRLPGSADGLARQGRSELSPAVIARMKGDWEEEHRHWQAHDLSAHRYVYLWADGVYLQARIDSQAECMLVLMGATPEAKKELVGFLTGMRESAQSWKELLVDLKARGSIDRA
jgi:hypothetical protein